MKFEKGVSGNPQGRPPGAKNKNSGIKEKVEILVLENWDRFKEDVKKMKPRDRAVILLKALDFVVPKLKAMEAKVENTYVQENPRLTPEQIDRLIEKL